MNDFKRVRTSNQFYNAGNVTFIAFGNLPMLFCSTETSDLLGKVFYLWQNIPFLNIKINKGPCLHETFVFVLYSRTHLQSHHGDRQDLLDAAYLLL